MFDKFVRKKFCAACISFSPFCGFRIWEQIILYETPFDISARYLYEIYNFHYFNCNKPIRLFQYAKVDIPYIITLRRTIILLLKSINFLTNPMPSVTICIAPPIKVSILRIGVPYVSDFFSKRKSNCYRTVFHNARRHKALYPYYGAKRTNQSTHCVYTYAL